MSEVFALCDEIGPEKVVHIHDHGAGLKAIVVIDNTAAGPAIGGVRMAPDVTLEECARLARAMTLKNAAAGLPHGGGKSVIAADPAMPETGKQALIRAFASAIAPLTGYIPGPDMGTNETCMAWLRDEIGRAVGLPRVLGGIPLDEIGATGIGVCVAAEVAAEHAGLKLEGARVAIQGFGAVGMHAARGLVARGARLVAVADIGGTVQDPEGLSLDALIALKQEGRSVAALEGAETAPREAVITADCDIFIPAARPDAITEANADRVRARLILEGANIPATHEAERRLHARGVLVVPDFIANAGGVICAAVEYHGDSEKDALEAIEERIGRNTREMLELMDREGLAPREAADRLALSRVHAAQALRRSFRA
ncbi:MAG: Glu/Leu/Phe/Val dehydrogenase [Alphaproteobacteria bacterium]|nr:MAG: Glu/Leu/Phe/Val dehydrogenase [Alphaproteobacteria bacterium]